MARRMKEPVIKTGDITIPTEGVAEPTAAPSAAPEVKRVPRKSKEDPSCRISVYMQSGTVVDLQFKSQITMMHAYKQISFKCTSGRPAVVEANGKEYTFCNVEYIIREAG